MLIETDEQDFLHDKATNACSMTSAHFFDLKDTVKTSKSMFVNLTKKTAFIQSQKLKRMVRTRNTCTTQTEILAKNV